MQNVVRDLRLAVLSSDWLGMIGLLSRFDQPDMSDSNRDRADPIGESERSEIATVLAEYSCSLHLVSPVSIRNRLVHAMALFLCQSLEQSVSVECGSLNSRLVGLFSRVCDGLLESQVIDGLVEDPPGFTWDACRFLIHACSLASQKSYPRVSDMGASLVASLTRHSGQYILESVHFKTIVSDILKVLPTDSHSLLCDIFCSKTIPPWTKPSSEHIERILVLHFVASKPSSGFDCTPIIVEGQRSGNQLLFLLGIALDEKLTSKRIVLDSLGRLSSPLLRCVLLSFLRPTGIRYWDAVRIGPHICGCVEAISGIKASEYPMLVGRKETSIIPVIASTMRLLMKSHPQDVLGQFMVIVRNDSVGLDDIFVLIREFGRHIPTPFREHLQSRISKLDLIPVISRDPSLESTVMRVLSTSDAELSLFPVDTNPKSVLLFNPTTEELRANQSTLINCLCEGENIIERVCKVCASAEERILCVRKIVNVVHTETLIETVIGDLMRSNPPALNLEEIIVLLSESEKWWKIFISHHNLKMANLPKKSSWFNQLSFLQKLDVISPPPQLSKL